MPKRPVMSMGEHIGLGRMLSLHKEVLHAVRFSTSDRAMLSAADETIESLDRLRLAGEELVFEVLPTWTGTDVNILTRVYRGYLFPLSEPEIAFLCATDQAVRAGRLSRGTPEYLKERLPSIPAAGKTPPLNISLQQLFESTHTTLVDLRAALRPHWPPDKGK